MAATKPNSTSASSSSSKLKPPSIPLYSQSSQFRNWRYSEEELEKIRRDLNVGAVNRVRNMVEEERAEQSHQSSTVIETTTISASTSTSTSTSHFTSTSRSGSPTPTPTASEIEYLTVSDELSLVTYYLTQVSALCGAFSFPEMVQATAMSYLKRFYLRNTCMDYHPKNVMLTCLFLATKTENHPISIDSFSSKIKTTPNDILSLEFLVSQSLKFEYKVHHAHLAAYGLSLDLQTTNLPLELIQSSYLTAQSHIATSRLTALEFIYTPAQIALASFRLASVELVDTYLGVKESKLSSSTTTTNINRREEDLQLDSLIKVLDSIGSVILAQKGKGVDVETVREVDKRLRFARNPEKVEGSALYKKRKAEEELEKDAKAKGKAAKRPISNDESVFT